MRGPPYSEEENLLVLDLYLRCRRLSERDMYPKISDLQRRFLDLGFERNFNSVKLKVQNFKAVDPDYIRDGRSGMSGYQRSLPDLWDRYACDPAALRARVDAICSDRMGVFEGRSDEAFSDRVIEAYGGRCCLTGTRSLLRAARMKPWAVCYRHDRNECDDVANGLCLNTFHDAAFDKGLFTLDEKLRMEISPNILCFVDESTLESGFEPYEGKRIALPKDGCSPGEDYLSYHRSMVFKC